MRAKAKLEYIEPNGHIDCHPCDCCGVGEISEIGGASPEENIFGLFQYGTERRYAYLMFTDIKRSKAGSELERYIEANGLGAVYNVPPRINPNTQNSLTVWLWSPNYNAISRWVERVQINNDKADQ